MYVIFIRNNGFSTHVRRRFVDKKKTFANDAELIKNDVN